MSLNERTVIHGGAGISNQHLALVGGKAVNLARLVTLGQRVPSWYAITTAAFRSAVDASALGDRMHDDLRELAAHRLDAATCARSIQEDIRQLDLPESLRRVIQECHDEAVPASGFVAVRSSAVDEDTAATSFAGLHDSFLFIHGIDRVLASIRMVWASAYNERALAYRLARSLPLENIEVGVIVQQMIDPAASGVMFTTNPTSGNVQEIVVSSLFGVGEGLVSVGLDADTFVFDKESTEIREEVAHKREQLVFDQQAGDGLARIPVPPGSQETRSLSVEQVRAVCLVGLEIERAYRHPQDIEFCFDNVGQLHILQARPVTTAEELGPAAGNRLLWDNSNIIESYSGVTSPMTFSFIRHAYTIVYHCFSEVMGMTPRTVRENQSTFENMLGLFRGQVYYNIKNWHRLIQLFPGYNYNKQFMESMMGVRKSADVEDEEAIPPSWRQRYLVELPALLRLVVRSLVNFARIRTLVDHFERRFEELYSGWSTTDFSTKEPHELMALYHEMEEKLLWNWKAPIINDFFVMIFYGTLKKLCTAWCGDESGSLQNDLICGEGGIISTAPTKMLLRLAGDVQSNAELRELVSSEPPDRLVSLVPDDPRFASFASSIATYLDLYGFRCVNELKLEEFSLKDRPAFLYQIIQNYVRMGDAAIDVEESERREASVRRQAEERAFAALSGQRGALPRRLIFTRVLASARMGVKNRENMRFARTKIYGLLRELLRALGDRFARLGILDERDDIFYLTIDELWDYIKGTAVTTQLRGLTQLRRAEFDSYRAETDRVPDDQFETYGMAYYKNRCKGPNQVDVMSEDGALQGTGCCPGEVTGPVKILVSPTEDARLAGEILVAERTDPGWVPLYPSVSGLLIERGSILSHSAIVAREMGIPTIVGVPGLTSTLEDGQHVTMNGTTGTVRISGDTHAPDSTSE